jgi:hypothetical protein
MGPVLAASGKFFYVFLNCSVEKAAQWQHVRQVPVLIPALKKVPIFSGDHQRFESNGALFKSLQQIVALSCSPKFDSRNKVVWRI